ncbi:creatininase family protein [Thermodesulfobacteriota bacterium]
MPAAWLQEQSCKEVEDYLASDNRVLIPVGSTEQHGNFAPIGTDTYVAASLAESASAKTGVLIAPPLWYGWSPHHMVRPGTISIRAEILLEVLFDVIKSLSDNGFKQFVVINGHRMVNLAWIQIAAERAQRELGVKVVLFDPAYMCKEIAKQLEFGPIGHADEIEISHMLFNHPDLVNMELARDNPHPFRKLQHIDPTDHRDTLGYVPVTREDLEHIFENTGDTIIGNPSQASPEKGRVYHEHLVGRLVEVLQQLSS